jgi:bacteriocin biosynthesis cyclodehydratase domain-containing protein
MPGSAPAGARMRLRRSLEVLTTPAGGVFVLRGGTRAEWMIRDATPAERAVMEALADGPVSAADLAGVAGCSPQDAAAMLDQLDGLGLLEPEAVAGRYDRQLIYLRDLAPDAEAVQERLRASRVVVLGCGGLGCWALAGLACTGIGTVVLVDDDTVALDNLNRQILYRFSDIGRFKVDAAREALAAFDPALRIEAHRRRVASEADVTELIAGADVVVETADWPPHLLSRWVDSACRASGVAHISAGQDPPKLRVGPFFLPDRPGCLACQETAAREAFPLYDDLVAMRARRHGPTATLGPASGIAGSLIASEVMHQLTGEVPPATAGMTFLIDIQTLSVTSEPVGVSPLCACAGDGHTGSMGLTHQAPGTGTPSASPASASPAAMPAAR